MSVPAWRKKLEQTARLDAPLCKAIKAGLRYTEDLELIVQQLADDLDEMDGRPTALARRARRLLEKGGMVDQ